MLSLTSQPVSHLLQLVLANKVMLDDSDFSLVPLIVRLMSDLWGVWQQPVTKMFGLNFCGDFGHRLWRKPLQQERKGVSLKMNEKNAAFLLQGPTLDMSPLSSHFVLQSNRS